MATCPRCGNRDMTQFDLDRTGEQVIVDCRPSALPGASVKLSAQLVDELRLTCEQCAWSITCCFDADVEVDERGKAQGHLIEYPPGQTSETLAMYRARYGCDPQ